MSVMEVEQSVVEQVVGEESAGIGALEGEITDYLGYEKHDGAGDGWGNSRYGWRAKTVLTDIGPVEIDVPRDRAGTFEPQIVKKRQRRLSGVDEMVLSLLPEASRTGRSPRTCARCTERTCPRPRSRRSPTR
jgi:transposase-like protein